MVRIGGTSPRRSSRSNAHFMLTSSRVALGLVVVFWMWCFLRLWQPKNEGRTTSGDIPIVLPPHQQRHDLAVDSGAKGNTRDDDRVVENNAGKGNNGGATSPITIGYAVSITGCGSDPLSEGAAVLRQSIHRVSSRGSLGGRYDYAMLAIYHPKAESCALQVKDLGYQMLKRDTPVAVKDIQGDFLRSKIESNGCCGEKELIKLEAYTLTQYPIVVHLDLDVLILKPLDELFDMMLQGPSATPTKALMWPDKPLPEKINAFYTHDYNMVKPHNPYKPVQGGFLVLRPDMNIYEEFRSIIREGDFRERGGWGGAVGPFYGSMTFQGLIPYYYLKLHPGQAVELNRCVYNQMCDNPRTEKTINDIVHGKCRDGQDECEDCRSRPLEDVATVHFTLCQKPWWCLPHDRDRIQERLCRKLIRQWYLIRSEMEKSWGRSGRGEGNLQPDQYFGYCTRTGGKGYIPIAKPYLVPPEKS